MLLWTFALRIPLLCVFASMEKFNQSYTSTRKSVQLDLSVLNALHNHLNFNHNVFRWQQCLDMCETCYTECPGLTPMEWISLQWTLVRPHYRTGKEESLCDLMTLPHGGGGGGGWDQHIGVVCFFFHPNAVVLNLCDSKPSWCPQQYSKDPVYTVCNMLIGMSIDYNK